MKPALVIIPTYNEIENIRQIIPAALDASQDIHVLVVDDGSPDGTGTAADQLASENSRVHVLHRKEKAGLGPAYVAGFRWGIQNDYEKLIEMDADFSHDPKYLPTMLSNLEKYDYVIGSRNIPGGGTLNWSWLRKLISWGGSLYSRLCLGAKIYDFTGGFNGWNRQVLLALDLDGLEAGGYSFQIELKYSAFKKGFSFKEFPILFEDRRVGKSKMSLKIVVEALLLVPKLRFKAQK